MTTLADIEKLTTNYASEKNNLDALIAEINADAEDLKKKYSLRLRKMMGNVSGKYEVLFRAIQENPALFEKPKTQIFEGIRVGIMQGKGSVQVEDEEQTITLIEKKLTDKADLLIKTTKSLVKTAIAQLSDQERAKIGVEIVGKESRVVITSVDAAVNKILNSIIKVSAEELKEEYEEAA